MIDQLRAELLRQRSTRTTLSLFLGMLALILVAVALHAFGLPASFLAQHETQIMVAGVGERLGVLFSALLGAVAITSEFRHGTIRPTLLVTPRRGRVFAAKVGVCLLLGAGFGVAAAVVAVGATSALLSNRSIEIVLVSADYTTLLLGGAAAGALWAAIGVGVGAIVRNQLPTLIGISAWLLFVEGLLVEQNSSLIAIGKYAPGSAAVAMTGQAAPSLLNPGLALIVLIVYVAVAVAAGWIATVRRDIP